MQLTFDGIAGLAMLLLVMAAVWRLWRRRKHIGPAASGTLQDMFDQDKRNAIEIIVEQKAEERRPEYPDGNLPELEKPISTKVE